MISEKNRLAVGNEDSESIDAGCTGNGCGASSAGCALVDRLERIESTLRSLLQQRVRQDFYSTSRAAELLGKADFTVREWCRLGRVRAEKRSTGRGRSKEWMISHEELERIRSEGLLPVRTPV